MCAVFGAVFSVLALGNYFRMSALNRVIVAQQEIIETLSTTASGLTEEESAHILTVFSSARLSQVHDGGAVAGLRVSNVLSDGFFARIGAREGDVIRSINGIEIHTAVTSAEALRLLSTRQDLTIRVTSVEGDLRILKFTP